MRGKTDDYQIPISDQTMIALRAMIATVRQGPIFRGYKGRSLTRQALYVIIRRLMQRAGIKGKKLGPHRLRHAFGKNYIANGGDLRSLQLLMGHASIKTTEIYVGLNLDNLTTMHNRFTPLRSMHAAAQGSFLGQVETAKENSEGESQ